MFINAREVDAPDDRDPINWNLLRNMDHNQLVQEAMVDRDLFQGAEDYMQSRRFKAQDIRSSSASHSNFKCNVVEDSLANNAV
jgi:hypothetical protein